DEARNRSDSLDQVNLMTRRLILCFGMLLLAGFSASVFSVERQEIPALLKAVENYVRSETAGFPGKISVSLGAVDPRLNLPACQALEPFVPAGGRLWGQAAVGVRCNGQTPWTVYVPVSVKVLANVVHAAKPLAQGQPVGAADIALQQADLAQLPAGILTEPAQAVGKTLVSNIASGQPLRHDMLRSPPVVLQGQTVKLLAQGRGFNVSSEGKALAAAAAGQVVQVRTHSGQIISGIARPEAVVEVRP
ncbi:MAG TPA: flagellar basal body P-ring formation chaperone FlgA, partial [Candidatus Glassbacteria bacterium]|nr:flagellar basal body P-ring formation chaperone FlgA [Candidatus Glassbacteria bacterium]